MQKSGRMTQQLPVNNNLTVIGLGSRHSRDDAVGLVLVESLRDWGVGVRVTTQLWEDADALTLAHDLLALTGPALVVDCADMGLAGGEWRFFQEGTQPILQKNGSVSTHGLGLASALTLARGLGYEHPVWLFGVQPFDLSPAFGLTPDMENHLAVLHSALIQAVQQVAPPLPTITLMRPLARSILAMGVESKGRIAYGNGSEVTLSSPMGNLETPEARIRLAGVVAQFLSGMVPPPEAIAVDLHPDFYPSVYGREIAKRLGVPVAAIQHHHAHGAACMAEHGLEEALALTFDGMGWGIDGHIWGAELLHIHPRGFSRLASFVPVPLPGGDMAVRHPRRQLAGRFFNAGVPLDEKRRHTFGLRADEAALWERQCAGRINAPLSHATGRLFDAVAALLGVAPHAITREGEAAMALEKLATLAPPAEGPPLPFQTEVRNGQLLVDWAELFKNFPVAGVPEDEKPRWAYAFHDTVVRAACIMMAHGVRSTNLRKVVLTGGVFMNKIIKSLILHRMHVEGFEPLLPQKLPVGDDAIVLGQVWIAGREVG